MDKYLAVMLIAGLASLGMAFMPAIAKRTGISYSLIYVAIGALVYLTAGDYLPSPLPQSNNNLTLHLSELIVIISLMGTGIKIDRSFSFRRWASPLRLVFIAMILCVLACTFLGLSILQVSLPAAILLAAVLSPTDPVLASDVQVGPPNEKVKSETKFALTSEAGLNDGMAFPFTWLAILAATAGLGTETLIKWASYYVLYKIAAGFLLGWLCGKLAAYLVFTVSKKHRLLKPTDGFVAIALVLFTYGLTELLHGYGFIAVFICGITLRHAEKNHDYHQELHSFTDQMERLLLGLLLILFGGSLVSGILEPLNTSTVVYALMFLLVIRPLTAYLALTGTQMHWKERLAICFFGIRGMGSIFYLAFALHEVAFQKSDELWAVVTFTMLLSIIMHGLTATRVMNHLKVQLPREPLPE
ncbi:cation:proton antiporter [Pedobacter faecalis]|uniref:cation:proton antiporter n=1 Tax=Pedobacter faecalis TaxID=3041495 RepID=UPI00254BBE9C|nr:cation:proton antiporter [Pedobacter sp. ELA7]